MNKFHCYIWSICHLAIWPLLLRSSNGQMNKFYCYILPICHLAIWPLLLRSSSGQMNKFYCYTWPICHLAIWPLLLRSSNGQMKKFYCYLLKRSSSGTHPTPTCPTMELCVLLGLNRSKSNLNQSINSLSKVIILKIRVTMVNQ